jgi:lipoate-protein ligase A
MRARLLDMGEVSAVRSQSITHAIAATMGPESHPAAILLRPASRLVSIGVERNPVDEVDLAECLKHRIPVMHRLTGGPARLIDRNRLMVSCCFPADSTRGAVVTTDDPIVKACRELELAVRLGPEGEIETGSVSEAAPRAIGNVRIGKIEESWCLVADLAIEPDPPQPESVLVPGVTSLPSSSLTRELGEQPASAVVAEAIVEALESSYALEYLPSMPTPDEMEAIYEWDERLVLDLETMAGAHERPAEQIVC